MAKRRLPSFAPRSTNRHLPKPPFSIETVCSLLARVRLAAYHVQLPAGFCL